MTSVDLPRLDPTVIDHEGRRQRLRDAIAVAEADAALITDLTNVRYLSGFTGSSGALLIAENDAWLITDGRYEEQAGRQAVGCETLIQPQDPSGRLADLIDANDLHNVLAEAAALTWARRDRLTEAFADTVKLRPTTGLVEELRITKDDHEIAAVAAACAITDAAFSALLEVVRPGMSEREVGRFLDRTMEDLGAQAPSFETIAASGPNSAVPHHRPTDRTLQSGELLKLDFGALYAGYHADMTRTVALGDPGDELRKVHAIVERSQAAGREAAVEGAATVDVDARCREIIVAEGYGERFVHGTGHGVGLVIHEDPFIGQTSTGNLRARSPITVEPGIYLPGRGGVRIEDTVLVQADGPPHSLTTSPRELLVL